MKKVLSLFIALTLLLSAMAAASCGETTGPAETTPAPAADSNPVSGQTTEAPDDGMVKNNVPDDLKFPGQTVRFMYWNDVERPEFFVENESGEPVNDAIYTRNIHVEEQLGIILDWIGTPGNYGNQAAFVTTAQNNINAGGTDTYDFFCGYSMTAPTLAVKGLTKALGEYPIIDLELPWWPESLVSKATINGKTFFVSGDISTNVLYMMYGVFFNKSIYENVHRGKENIYEVVKNKEWTIDKLVELSEGVYEDLNNNNVSDYGDRFGFQSIDLHFDAFYIGAGLTNIVIDEAGNLVISPDFEGETAIDLAEKVCNFLFKSGNAYGSGTTSKDSSAAAFSRGEALFAMDRVYIASGTLKNSDVEYGLIPVPMYNTDQENYVSCMAFPFTFYSMSTATTQGEAAAATLEDMAYESYILISPALFDQSMKSRYSSEANDAQMYDLIHDTICFELGRIFTTELDNLSYSVWRNCIKSNQGSHWKTLASMNAKRINKLLEGPNAVFNP